MINWIAAASCLLAAVPTILFLRNLALYAPLPKCGRSRTKLSVLIPARNEETNIAAAMRSILASAGVDLELIVLDDHSTDRTAEIVRDFADPRVRLETTTPLPAGWVGKNFACYQLAALARHPLLVFIDADVRVSRPDSLARLAGFVEQSGAALVSGVPREETCGLLEKLIIPLIHFILLGFLPLQRMRAVTDPHFAAACGQIIAVRRDVYERTGGHAAIANSLHDAIALARSFRSHGFGTDLFDATDTFDCRMYQSAAEVWNGFAKNAHEGLGSSRLIVPATLLLLGGQVLPFCLLAFGKSPTALVFAVIGTAVAILPRLIAVSRFRQSLLGALLHPLGIIALVAIQWWAFFRSLRHGAVVWKGRSYSPAYAS
ncbi:MAG: glycosyltransferase family 2 protein [Verrucomicrobiota bacterium]|nr:glycosyltransferase family 2 protein [Verrucomicrobiota bacterium]